MKYYKNRAENYLHDPPQKSSEKKDDKVRITYIDYDETSFREQEITDIKECFPFKDTPTVTWINIDGLHDVTAINKIGLNFNLHPLILEDITDTGQRPRFEQFEDHLYIVLKMLYYNEKDNILQVEQVSLIIGANYVISLQEKVGDVFEPIRERIRAEKSRIRKEGPDYLAYSILDTIVDNYFAVLEKIGDKIDPLEKLVVRNPQPASLRIIHRLKRLMITLRKSVWPLREVINNFAKAESSLVKGSTKIYLRDVYEHTIHVIDTVETYRDMLSGIHDTYLSSISYRLNEIMKVLTIIATIFIPLTFITGIYGMNFRFMPEINWKWGYFGALALMLAVGVTMLIYFRKRKWM